MGVDDPNQKATATMATDPGRNGEREELIKTDLFDTHTG